METTLFTLDIKEKYNFTLKIINFSDNYMKEIIP